MGSIADTPDILTAPIYKRVGHLFQGRYKGILIDKDNYLIELSRYVHLTLSGQMQ
jgi:hypothetical protein